MNPETKYLDNQIRKFIEISRISYFKWVQYVTSLSVIILTVLVTFKEKYVKENIHCLCILQKGVDG